MLPRLLERAMAADRRQHHRPLPCVGRRRRRTLASTKTAPFSFDASICSTYAGATGGARRRTSVSALPPRSRRDGDAMATFRLDRLRLRGTAALAAPKARAAAGGGRAMRLIPRAPRAEDERERVLGTRSAPPTQRELDGAGLHIARATGESARGPRSAWITPRHGRGRRAARRGQSQRNAANNSNTSPSYRERRSVETALARRRMLDRLTMSRHARRERRGAPVADLRADRSDLPTQDETTASRARAACAGVVAVLLTPAARGDGRHVARRDHADRL